MFAFFRVSISRGPARTGAAAPATQRSLRTHWLELLPDANYCRAKLRCKDSGQPPFGGYARADPTAENKSRGSHLRAGNGRFVECLAA